MNCFIPIIIIIYLDTGCLGRWAALWKPCRSNRQLFERSLICNFQNQRDCRSGWISRTWEIDIVVARSSDICNPHHSQSLTYMSTCIHISLLRLQEILLGKFITTEVVMPGVTLLRRKLPVKSGELLAGNFAIYMAYAMVSSGHLPLMMPMLLLAISIAGLVARFAWAERGIGPMYVENVAAPVVKLTRLLSLMAHLASAAGDPLTLAMAGSYIFMHILTLASVGEKRDGSGNLTCL